MTGMGTCLLSNVVSQEWIVDSGTSHHIAADRKLSINCRYVARSQRDK